MSSSMRAELAPHALAGGVVGGWVVLLGLAAENDLHALSSDQRDELLGVLTWQPAHFASQVGRVGGGWAE